jgi:Rubisco LSMT substrate-binding
MLRLLVILLGGVLLSLTSRCCFAFTPPTTTTTTSRTTAGRTAALRATKTNKAKEKEQASSSSVVGTRSILASLQKWASETAGIKTSPTIQLQQDESGNGGRGWLTTTAASSTSTSTSSSTTTTVTVIQPGALLLTVPASVALTVQCPGYGPDDGGAVRRMLGQDNGRQVLKQLPWFVQMALYLYRLDQIDSYKNTAGNQQLDMRVWLDSLPRPSDFNTPIHWTIEQRKVLLQQYPYLEQSVAVQEVKWKKYYNIVQKAMASSSSSSVSLSYDDFVWYCELARSRAFSSNYSTGAAFSPTLYAFTLLLVAAYLALGLGTLEQAANGAGVVFCGAVLKDFVWPKLFNKDQRLYVLAPLMDMANHKSTVVANSIHSKSHQQAEVSFEYFGNTYSLAAVKNNKNDKTPPQSMEVDSNYKNINSDNTDHHHHHHQVYISYGERSNDQLLQFYGFIETDNPYDVYILPPLRDWNIAALEQVVATNMSHCRPSKFAAGRLQKLDAAGLLGSSSSSSSSTSSNVDMDGSSNNNNYEEAGGIVVTRQFGLDPAVLQALRALVSTEAEWTDAGQAGVARFAEYVSADNECAARLVAQTALEMELQSKATTLQQDQELLQVMLASKKKGSSSSSSMVDALANPHELLALRFRIEKKKLLLETIDKLR